MYHEDATMTWNGNPIEGIQNIQKFCLDNIPKTLTYVQSLGEFYFAILNKIVSNRYISLQTPNQFTTVQLGVRPRSWSRWRGLSSTGTVSLWASSRTSSSPPRRPSGKSLPTHSDLSDSLSMSFCPHQHFMISNFQLFSEDDETSHSPVRVVGSLHGRH